MLPLEITFWAAVGFVAYVYIGYPVLIGALARLRPRPVRTGPVTPTITVLIAACDEEARIAAKIENCLALDYPAERLDIIVVSDGSTDRTASIVATYASRLPGRVTLIEFPERRGKASALNAGAARAQGEVLLLADVRQRFDRLAARALARNFADPEVGAASGELMLLAEGEDRRGAGLGVYWRYEKAIRLAESRVGSSMGYTGSVSAVRRSLYPDLPADTLIDDLVVALCVIARRCRVVFEPAAQAFDSVSTEPGHEFARKVRTLAGVLQTCVNSRRLAGGPLGFCVWWQLLSHKASRLAVPYALATILVASALLDGPIYRLTLLVQGATYGLGCLGLLTGARGRWGRIVALPSTFLMLNAAAVVGVLRYASGRRLDLWRPPVPRTDGDPTHVCRTDAVGSGAGETGRAG